MEKVLAVPQPDRIPQETGFWCGPASCQSALQVVINEVIPEQQLAGEMGTTENGTNHIGLLADCLNAHAHHAKWEAVWLKNDPPSPAQCEDFWVKLKASIDAGFPCPANWVAPPGNHPVAVRGSGPNPGYSGTIFHYICYTGYAEDETGRYVHVTDSGFAPWQYWVTFQQACSLMPPKGFVWASAAPIGATPTPTLPGPVEALPGPSAELLSAAMGGSLSLERYSQLLPGVLSCLEACEANNVERVAEWMGQIGHESGGLQWMEELADGSQYEGRADLGNTSPGDGVRYKGRGPIQITGKINYTAVSEWAHSQGYVDSPTYFVDNPEKLADDVYGFMGTAWYWTVARPNINGMCDAGDIEGVTRAINGGLNGFDDRKARYENAKPLAPQFLNAGPPATEGEDFLSALTEKEQREMLFLLRILADQRFPSRSPLRHIGEGPVDTVAGMTLNTDASTHIMLVIELAKMGDTGAIDLLNEVAQNSDPERQGDAMLAKRILAALAVDHTVDQTPYDPRPAATPVPPAAPVQPAAPVRGPWRL